MCRLPLSSIATHAHTYWTRADMGGEVLGRYVGPFLAAISCLPFSCPFPVSLSHVHFSCPILVFLSRVHFSRRSSCPFLVSIPRAFSRVHFFSCPFLVSTSRVHFSCLLLVSISRVHFSCPFLVSISFGSNSRVHFSCLFLASILSLGLCEHRRLFRHGNSFICETKETRDP